MKKYGGRGDPAPTRPRVRAPEFPLNYSWLNTEKPLLLKELRGRVVILDFWSYCCINCLHVLPDLKYLEQKYKDSLTVIGVHSAKFDNEKDIENIRQAILRYDIEHPVLVDRDFRVWQEYAVRAYPTFMVIDPQGYVIDYFAGEGKRSILDELIGKLIGQYQEKGNVNFHEISLTLEKQWQPLITPLAFPGKVLATNAGLFIADTGHHRIVGSGGEGGDGGDKGDKGDGGDRREKGDGGDKGDGGKKGEGGDIYLIGSGKSGLRDGDFESAQFFSPQGMTFDAENQVLYVADTGNHALRRVDLKRRVVETIAGTGTQSKNIHPHCGNALETALNSPWDLVKIGDSLYIAQAGSHQIWKMDLVRGTIGTYAGIGAEGCFDGELLESVFAQPSGITSNGENLYVADSETSTIRIVGLGESARVKIICGSGDLYGFGDNDGIGEDVRLQHCLGVEYSQNHLWIADTYNHKIKLVNLQTGSCQTVLGNGTTGLLDGLGTNAGFFEPSGLSVFDSKLYVADTNNHRIRCVDLKTFEVTTLEFPGLCSPDVCFPCNI